MKNYVLDILLVLIAIPIIASGFIVAKYESAEDCNRSLVLLFDTAGVNIINKTVQGFYIIAGLAVLISILFVVRGNKKYGGRLFLHGFFLSLSMTMLWWMTSH